MRMYSVAAEFSAAEAASTDAFELLVPSNKVVILHSVRLGQITLTGEADSLMANFVLSRATTSGSGGSTNTPRPLDPGDAAAGTTCENGNTTTATGLTVLERIPFNFQSGLLYIPTPEERVIVPGGARLVGTLALASFPNADHSSAVVSCSVKFEEIG